ncbi:MAG: hypothetical protein HKN13_06620 [Rhodothermales bacterium]|nr:hypothetical protein [Rhodothermales bacterium]
MSNDEQLLSRFIGFASLGVLTTTQELAGRVLESIGGADPQAVAEESFSLVAVTSARAAEVGFSAQPALGHSASIVLASLPLYHRDYLVGGAVLAEADPHALVDTESLARRLSFYAAHFPEASFPGPIALKDKMELWMGRVSVPGLDGSPAQRVSDMQAVDTLHLHLRLLLGFARQMTSTD